ACKELKAEGDEVVCAITPEPFLAVGHWYEDFSQTTDEEVRDLLARRQHPEPAQPAQDTTDIEPLAAVRKAAHPLTGSAGDYDPLMELIGERRFVLLGEASHGTHEFYRERARITQRLIEEKGLHGCRGRGGLAGCLPRQPLYSRRRRRCRCQGGPQRL